MIIVTHKACHTQEIYKDMVEILLILQAFLAEDAVIEYLLCGALLHWSL